MKKVWIFQSFGKTVSYLFKLAKNRSDLGGGVFWQVEKKAQILQILGDVVAYIPISKPNHVFIKNLYQKKKNYPTIACEREKEVELSTSM